MKSAVILLALACAVLLAALVLRGRNTGQQVAAAQADSTALSNKLAEARTRLAEQEQVVATLQVVLSNRSELLTGLSNRLAASAAKLTQSDGALSAAQGELEHRRARLVGLTNQVTDLTLRLSEATASVGTLQHQLAQSQQRIHGVEAQRLALANEVTTLQADKDRLLRQFNDADVLRAQLQRLKTAPLATRAGPTTAAPDAQQAAPGEAQSVGAKKKLMKVELQPDGSVRLVPTAD
jgi:chromosome segregation ATPase